MAASLAPAVRGEAPRVPGWPVVGPLWDVHRDLLGVYERAHRECGDVARLVLGPPGLRLSTVLVMHPDGVRQVLAGHGRAYGKDSPIYREVRGFLGSGLLTSQDEDWERQRRMLQPLFTPRRVGDYAEAMREEADEVVGRWRRTSDGVVDLHEASMTYTLQVVGRLLFGSSLAGLAEVLERTMEPLQEHMVFRGVMPARLPRQWPTPGSRRAWRHTGDLYAVVDGLLDDAERSEADAGGRTVDRTDLLTLLLRAQDPVDGSRLSRQEVRDQLLIFVLAGYETTANALTYTLHLLGRHPDVQERVRREAAEGLAAPVEGLSYTRQVVSEAMRLYPPACHIARSAREDDVVLGHRVRAGDPMTVPVWVLHRDPRWWPDPLRFDPDRFTPEATARQRRYSYLPFGGGPRSCIGAQFAMLEASVLVAAVTRSSRVVVEEPMPPLYPGITLRPRRAVPARLEPLRP